MGLNVSVLERQRGILEDGCHHSWAKVLYIGVHSSRGLGEGEACTKFMMCGTTTKSRT